MEVDIRLASVDQRPAVERLIQLYLYDMASEHPWPIGPDGAYGYDFLDRFWQHPYLIYAEGALAGFALVIRGCPITGRADCWFMAEFFVLRPYRRQGLGRTALAEALRRHPGDWHVTVIQSNAPALSFWQAALAAFRPTISPAHHDGEEWQVMALQARVSATAGDAFDGKLR